MKSLVMWLHHDSALSHFMVHCCVAYTLQQACTLGCLVLIMFNAPAIPSGQNPIHKCDDCKAVPCFCGARISSSEYIIHSGEADVPQQSWCRDPSPCKQMNLWPRQLLWSRVVLWQAVFIPGKGDAMQFVSTDCSAGHMPHLLGSAKPALQRY